jgi:DNA polymerase-3 subunit beta
MENFMKITLTRRDIKSMTTGFSKIVPGKGTLAILSCVCFRSYNSKVTAEATDLDQTAIYSLDNSAAEGEGVILVPLALLRRLSKGTDKETVNLENDGDNILVTNNVGSHAVTQTVSAPDPEDWPPAGGEIKTAPAPGFINAYNKLVPFASTDPTRLAINAVYVDASEEGTTLVATDGRRLTTITADLPKLKDGVIIPISRFLQWNQLPEDAEIGESKCKSGQRFCLRAGPWTYRIKAYDGIYPNYKQVIPSANAAEHTIIFNDDEVSALSKIIQAFPGDDEYICLECCDNGQLNICGKDHEGDKDLCIPLTGGSSYKGKGCRVAVNRVSLLDALSAGFTEYAFADNCSPLLSSDGNGGTHVLMPLRLNGPVSSAETAENAETAETAETAENTETTQDQKSETSTTEQAAAQAQPVPAKVEENKVMAKKENIAKPAAASDMTALEKLQTAYDIAKAKVRETQLALADVAVALRDATKEDRIRRKEVESVRAGLQKLQSIQV